MVLKSFRTEVSVDDHRWILVVPTLDNLRRHGDTLLEAEQKMREAIAEKVCVERNTICLELQDRRGLAGERTRRAEHIHPAPASTLT
jgi:predicted RNase H-like HicB family nuclease